MKSLYFPILGTLLPVFALLPAPSPRAQPLENPVVQCADCVMMKHRGTYYMTGTGAEGEMLVSQNLTDWNEPVPFFQTRLKWTHQKHTLDMHAPSLKYHNGKFYFYWNSIVRFQIPKTGTFQPLEQVAQGDGARSEQTGFQTKKNKKLTLEF